MKIKLLILFLTVTISTAFFWFDRTRTTPKNSIKIPTFSHIQLPNLSGGAISLKKIKSENLFVHFWATWCAPCVEELPELVTYAKQNPQHTFLTVSVDKSPNIIPPFLKRLSIDTTAAPNIIWAHDPHQKISGDAFNVYQFPETHLLDENKQLIRKLVGQQDWSTLQF